MASPQLEYGYTRLANEILEALARTNLSAYQARIILAIIRKTYGFQKTKDWISNSQLVSMTGISQPHVSRTISELSRRNIVTRNGKKLGLQKNYELWTESPKRVTDTDRGDGSYPAGVPQKNELTVQNMPNGVTKVTKQNIPNGVYKYTQRGIKNIPNGVYTKEKKKKNKQNSGFSSFRKEEDPNVQIVVNYFCARFSEIMGVPPDLGAPDYAAVKKELLNRTVPEIKGLISFVVDFLFRAKPEGKGMLGTLKTCFAPIATQTHKVEWEKRKWNYGDQEKPITDAPWWH